MGFHRNSHPHIHPPEMKFAAFLSFFCWLALSCATNQEEKGESADSLSPLSADEVLHYYNLYREGKYANIVQAMHSCDSMDSAYKEQMAMLFKQHATEQKEQHGEVRFADVDTILISPSQIAATATISLTYADGGKETIQLQFVRDGKEWRLR